MIPSLTAQYAIRAMVFLALNFKAKYLMVKTIAQENAIPLHFLAKILQALAKRGLLKSMKGPLGGFCLARKPGDITLFDVIEATDGAPDVDPEFPRYIGKTADTAMRNYQARTTIADLARKLKAAA